jgi:predicted DNA-binding transcriptional regulator YafY
MRVFRVSRIQDAALLDEHITRPDGFDLRTYWAAWCAEFERSIPRYPVTVRVAPDAVLRLQRLLGEEVRIHLEQASPPDATGWRTIPVTFERVDDARRALLGCGTLVEVVEPWELRAHIAEAAAGVVSLYAQ